MIAGIGQGIINWLANVGTWMYNNIWTPFVNGFKSTFSIQSPSTSPTIQGLGSDLIHGLFNGIVNWLSNISSWLKTNAWDKIVNGFQTLFSNPIKVKPKLDPVISVDEDGFGGSKGGTFGKDNGKDATPSIEVQGVLKGIDQSKLPPKQKIIPGVTATAEKMSDRMTREQKTFNTTSRFTGRSDSLNTSQKTFDTTSRFSYRTDNLSASQKTLNTTSRFANVTDALSDAARKIKATAYMVKLIDALSDAQKRIQIAAQIVPGWRGSLASYLGIDKIKTTLYLQAPKVHISWDKFRWYNTTYSYPRSFYTTYYARGGILDVFPPALSYPLRIEFFGDEIDQIRAYDPDTQRSVENVQSADIGPAAEFIPDETERAQALHAICK